MSKIARLAIARRWWIVVGWIAAIVAIQLIAGAMGGAKYKDDFKLPHTETQAVGDLLAKAGLDQANNPSGSVVLQTTHGTLASQPAGVAAKIETLCTNQAADIASVTTPWSSVSCTPGQRASGAGGGGPGEADLLSPDKKTAILNVTFGSQQADVSNATAVYDALKTMRSNDLQVEFTGDMFTDVDAKAPNGLSPQTIGFIAAFIILIVAFRTFGAAVLPLVSAAVAMGAGMGLIAILSHGISVASWAPQLADLMVIGVGIDYALFVVTRHRRNLMSGMSVNDSIVNALNTSGRAVLFAGTTVCIALLGLCALGISFLYGVAIGTSIAVTLTMVASLTLLPAMLSFLGLKVLPRRKRKAVRAGQVIYTAERGRWFAWARFVQKHSTLTFAAALVIIGLLAVPFFSLRLGHADQSNDPAGTTTRRGYDMIQTAFGKGYNSNLELVISGPQASDKAYLNRVSTTLAGVPDVAKDSISVQPVKHDVALVAFKSTTGPQDAKTDTLVKTLRGKVLPQLYEGTGNHIYVYGMTAIMVDFAKVLSAKMLLFFLAVIGLSFILLLVAFRSMVVPVTAAIMNLFAAAASFGVTVAIFQWGWFGDTIGVGKGGPIEAFVPVIFFAILFGLSMDYQVFLVSRMHEEWVHTKNNHRAVMIGQGETGGIITAAALIMISVFSGFILGDGRVIKLFGIGLASAIFLDAFVVRTLLVPSLMHKLGRGNWYFPKWLERITPRVSLEAPEEDVPVSDLEPLSADEDPRLVRV
jgi:RND superfamily putative drug exporter